MSQTEHQQPIDPHAAMYREVHRSIDANHMLYEYLASGVVSLLPDARAQHIEDALNMTCVALGNKPLELLLLIHEFLSNYQSIVQHEQASAPPEDSPYMMREEG